MARRKPDRLPISSRECAASPLEFSRRQWLRLSSASALGAAMAPWFQLLAEYAAHDPRRRRSCILLWMSGGPSQLDTFDMKPGHRNGGQFKPIATATPGLQISELLPRLAGWSDQLAIVRSMTSKEGDHGRATQLVRSGYLPTGPVRYPTFGSLVAKELGSRDADIPNFVSIAPFRALSPNAYGPGFLGSQYAPLMVGDGQAGTSQDDYRTALQVEDIAAPPDVDDAALGARIELLSQFNQRFTRRRPEPSAVSHGTAYERAVRLMRSDASKAFDLNDEPESLRDAYGRNRFGQGCLLARRLVERGVPFVEVTHGGVDGNGIGWDTHIDNFASVRRLCDVLDPAWAALMADLRDRGLLETTLIVWMGEFGRTPAINDQGGRDHFPQAWCSVLAGGGIRGGQAIGRTDAAGMAIEDRPVTVPDLLATVCKAIGIDPQKQNMSNVARPIRIVDPAANPLTEVVA